MTLSHSSVINDRRPPTVISDLGIVIERSESLGLRLRVRVNSSRLPMLSTLIRALRFSRFLTRGRGLFRLKRLYIPFWLLCWVGFLRTTHIRRIR